MNLMFWKKKTTAEDGADDMQEKTAEQAAPQPSPGHATVDRQTGADEDAETASAAPILSRRPVIIGTAVGGALILIALGWVTWKLMRPFTKPAMVKPAVHKIEPVTEIQPEALPGKPLIKLPPIEHIMPEEIHANDRPSDSSSTAAATNKPGENSPEEIEALRKKNSELQAQIEILKQRQPASSAHQSASNAKISAGRTSVAVDTKDPKAAAKSLKEVIEELNASSGESPGKQIK